MIRELQVTQKSWIVFCKYPPKIQNFRSKLRDVDVENVSRSGSGPKTLKVRRNAGLCLSVKTGVFYAFLEVKFTKKNIHPYSKLFAGCLCIIFILA